MIITRNKILASVAVVMALAVTAYLYWSPYIAVRQLQDAAQNRDAEAFNEKVDYPALRESLKGQFTARVASVLGKQGVDANPFAALGTAIGMAMVNQLVDALVRPEVVMYAFNTGQSHAGRNRP